MQRDFIHNGGTYMVLGGVEGFPSSHIIRVQTNMISAARIPHHLTLRLKELDFKVVLQYDITDKKMLSHLLKSEKLNMAEYYGLLLQIVSTLEESKLYMLQPDKYKLNEDYIFVEGTLQIGSLYLTYVPVLNMESVSVGASLSHLITRLMTAVSALQGNGVQRLLQYVADDGFTLLGLRRMLLNLLAEDGEQSVSHEQRRINSPPRVSTHPSIESHSQRFAVDREIHTASNQIDDDRLVMNQLERRPVKNGVELSHHQMKMPSSTRMNESDESEMEEDSERNSAIRTYLMVGYMLVSALLWKFLYMNNPSKLMLFVSIVLTVSLGILTWMGWRGKLHLRSGADQEEPLHHSLSMFDSGELVDSSPVKKHNTPFQVERLTGFFSGSPKEKGKNKLKEQERNEMKLLREKWTFPESPNLGSKEPLWEPEPKHVTSFHKDDEEGNYYAQLGHRTEMLSSSRTQATVLLKPEISIDKVNSLKSPQPCSYLERREEGQDVPEGRPLEVIELHCPHFIIGRSTDVAQFVEEMPGTSRAHVELSRVSGGGYVIKDLGSKNGTILNKQSMVSYKEYTLQDGDVFTIVRGEYTYRSA
ncbi:DUF6382 domain-containing protein [Paenibacillus sp. IHBB 10380]|uniref:DUF6382 domain-containing protein n=1 Tax=Paenibacillus sp. IHBB 10380 TaxID=1566358 RepID=UPI0005CFDF11|nr:DUF6382 domain-containing protein [Paenibacillus sp. IHBB 10380]AJS61590.1 hypothetical protein UB51_16580 [Paenibacillus sp. IHBB 10380]